ATGGERRAGSADTGRDYGLPPAVAGRPGGPQRAVQERHHTARGGGPAASRDRRGSRHPRGHGAGPSPPRPAQAAGTTAGGIVMNQELRCDEALEILEAYLDGDLPAAEASRVREHLERCPACAAELELAGRIQRELRSLP